MTYIKDVDVVAKIGSNFIIYYLILSYIEHLIYHVKNTEILPLF